jgi:hypothetical protein
MSPSVSRPFFKAGLSGVSALLLLALPAGAQTISETLQGVGGSSLPFITVPNFTANNETLVDVTFTLAFSGNPVTVYDAGVSGSWLLNVNLQEPGSTSLDPGTDFSDWLTPGKLNISYTENVPNAPSYGSVASFLFGKNATQDQKYLEVNFVTTSNGGNNNGGGTPINGGGGDDGNTGVTPEPNSKDLSLLAAGVMAALLAGRTVRQRSQALR